MAAASATMYLTVTAMNSGVEPGEVGSTPEAWDAQEEKTGATRPVPVMTPVATG